jgi:hypothetical protein
MLAASPPRTSSVDLPAPRSRARTQVGLFLLAYLVYSAARWVMTGDLATAQDHAAWIVDLEEHLGVASEASIQEALSGTWAIWLLNHAYIAAQLIVVPGVLIFLYRRALPVYYKLRNTILATWLISVPVYAAFPVAPPRLADMGLVDTISEQTGFAMDSNLTTAFYNELAAVPSLHVGFAVAVGIAVAAAVRNPIVRVLALLWGPLIGLAVVATGNHFVFDIAAGLLASALGYGVGTVAARAKTRRPAATSAAKPLRPALGSA